MDTVVATVSGYQGAERLYLQKLISQSGASYVGSLNPSITHLVCRKFEGKKYELARKSSIIVVNHRWIEDCVKQGRRVSEKPYMKQCGFVMGPFLLDIPVAAAKTTVIDVESGRGDDDDEMWTDSLLLKENPFPDARQNKDCSNRSKRKLNNRSSRQDVSLTNKYDLPESPSFVLRRIESKDLSFSSPTQRVNRTKETTAICESSKGYRRLMRRNMCNELSSSSDSEEGFQHTEIHRKDVEIGESSKYSGRHESRKSYKTRHDHPKRRTLILEDSEKIEDLDTFNLQDQPKRRNLILEDSENIEDLDTSNLQDQPKRRNLILEDSENIEDLDTYNLHDQPKRRNLILEDSENIEDLGTFNLQDPACNEDDSNEREKNPTLSTQVPLSCVICWTEFSSTRGVLPCGHRFCFSCIQNWADHMASMKMVSTCPLCKASFCSIRKMEDAVSSDQKVYSQTIPNNHAAMDVYVLPYGQAPMHQMMPPPRPVCYQCFCREPEELLIRCYSCDLSCVHSYCLDPPQNPWVCVQCKDLRMRYIH